jgi:hypothetical protein
MASVIDVLCIEPYRSMDIYLIVINYFTGDDKMKAEREETAVNSFLRVAWVTMFVYVVLITMMWFVLN